MIGPKHTCGSFNNCSEMMTSNKWVDERVVNLLRDDPEMGPKELQNRLKKYSIEIPYDRVVRGNMRAIDTIYGKWADNYDLLSIYQAELLRIVPGSIIEIDIKEDDNGIVCFSMSFVALIPRIDEFFQGCRPYIVMDATHLIGRSRVS
jgi:hypothetical protein